MARHVVRVDPEIWTDVDFATRLSIDARACWFDSLFFLAAEGGPASIYPHTELVRDAGPLADRIASELMDFGLWEMAALGYLVRPYSGCRVRPETRAVIPAEVRRLVLTRDGYRCVACSAADDLTLDHIYPWSLGGPDDEDNLRTLCRSCNSSKGARI